MNQFEIDSESYGIQGDTQKQAIVSIAISLKRIADEISGIPYNHEPGADNTKHKSGIVDGIMLAIEQGILAARQSG